MFFQGISAVASEIRKFKGVQLLSEFAKKRTNDKDTGLDLVIASLTNCQDNSLEDWLKWRPAFKMIVSDRLPRPASETGLRDRSPSLELSTANVTTPTRQEMTDE